MFQQPVDFRDESEALYELIAPLTDAEFERKSQFKNWTINDVVSHLHAWNFAADLALSDPDKFTEFRKHLFEEMAKGRPLRDVEQDWLNDLRNRDRLEQWRTFYLEMTGRFAEAEPKRRVGWAGPDMSVRSSITARLMETWAHGQEVYDLIGVERIDTDRIKNIAVLGVNTFGWTFINRGQEVPSEVVHVQLTAPSGQTWTWNEGAAENKVSGSATEFCQVVTQVRNIGDTQLQVIGDTATLWMSIAQCFAGPAEDPPPVGSRARVDS